MMVDGSSDSVPRASQLTDVVLKEWRERRHNNIVFTFGKFIVPYMGVLKFEKYTRISP